MLPIGKKTSIFVAVDDVKKNDQVIYADMKSVCGEVCEVLWIYIRMKHISDMLTICFGKVKCGVFSAQSLTYILTH